MSEQDFHLATGHWLRFGRYEMRGHSIVPCEKSRRRVYDPWALDERPYLAFARLGADRSAMEMAATKPAVVEKAIDWARRFGLLGLVNHRVKAVTLWPRWRRMKFKDRRRRDAFEAEQITYVSSEIGWLVQQRRFGDPIGSADRVDSPLTEEEFSKEVRSRIALVSGSHELGGLAEEPLDKTWCQYFPDVPFVERARYDYPTPMSPRFWPMYGEPVTDIMYSAWMLANAIECITQPKHAQAPARGMARLSFLASCGLPQLVADEKGVPRQRWLSKSLLSTLALMAMEDLAGGSLRSCRKCSTLFVSDRYQAAYCAERCRWAAQKSRHRASRQVPTVGRGDGDADVNETKKARSPKSKP